jgi:hypothetical protein
MNVLLPSRFVEGFTRLLIGIQPMDALRRQRLAPPVYEGPSRPSAHSREESPRSVRLIIEPKPFPDPLTPDLERWLRARIDSRRPLHDSWTHVPRHPSCRFALVYEPDRGWASIDVRLLDAKERIAPRRLRIPLVDLGNPEDLAVLDALPVGRRARFPAFYAGAAYDVSERATGLRGRVVISDGGTPPKRVPVRWPRVEARRAGLQDPIAWAHGDQHGEFLLILPPESIPQPAVELPGTLTLQITAYGRRTPPVSPPPMLVQRADPLWDLPLEQLAAPGVSPDTDLVSQGRAIPGEYDGSITQSVTFTYSQIISRGVLPFDIT